MLILIFDQSSSNLGISLFYSYTLARGRLLWTTITFGAGATTSGFARPLAIERISFLSKSVIKAVPPFGLLVVRSSLN